MPTKREPLVATTEGPVLGAMDGDIYVFKGIPYALPPVGERRWRPPVPITRKTKDVLIAQERGASSLQNPELCMEIGGGDPRPTSEDCLYLNIWTPNIDEAAEALPVMVWIYGGGYVVGAGHLPPYVGTQLASRQAVVVNINYRLGHLGFFAHPALDLESRRDGSPVINNFALCDQIEALTWVKHNIARFGGNPNNVTIFGQSAGARSVLSLFASPLAGNLFHKGVAQSAYVLPDKSRAEALGRGVAVATYYGLPGAEATAVDLRNIDVNQPDKEIWNIPPYVGNPPVLNPAAFGLPTPISGDAVLPVPLLDAFILRRQLKLPLVIGSNSDDSSVLAEFKFGPNFIIYVLNKYGKYQEAKEKYGNLEDDELGRQVGRDALFTFMSYLIVDAHTAAQAPSWRYYFDYVAQGLEDMEMFRKGTPHSFEIPFVFNIGRIPLPPPHPDVPFFPRDQEFANKVCHYWLEFARSAPNASVPIPGDPPWPKHIRALGIPPNSTMMLGRFSKNLPDRIELEGNFLQDRYLFLLEFLKDLESELTPDGKVHSFQ